MTYQLLQWLRCSRVPAQLENACALCAENVLAQAGQSIIFSIMCTLHFFSPATVCHTICAFPCMAGLTGETQEKLTATSGATQMNRPVHLRYLRYSIMMCRMTACSYTLCAKVQFKRPRHSSLARLVVKHHGTGPREDRAHTHRTLLPQQKQAWLVDRTPGRLSSQSRSGGSCHGSTRLQKVVPPNFAATVKRA